MLKYQVVEKRIRLHTLMHIGGAATTIETVENLLKIPVDYYVKMNFNAFVDVIDALGGIKIEVPYAFAESNSNETK